MQQRRTSPLVPEWPIALIWLTYLFFALAGGTLKPDLVGQGVSIVLLVAIVVVMLAAIFRVVHHAECLAELFGEPFGTLILTLSVIGIEVALITAVMLTGDNNPTLARDTMFSVLMIVLNGLVGLCLLVGGLRHGFQIFNLSGANAYLVALLPVATTALILPHFTSSAPGGSLSTLQAAFQIGVSVLLYGFFLLFQTVKSPDVFQQPAREAVEPKAEAAHSLQVQSVGFHVAGLLLALLPLVLMSKKLAVYVDFGIAQVGAPVALGGFIVAVMILAPEGLTALVAARHDQLQRAVNICLGSALATISLTVPAVLIAAWIVDLPVELGLDAVGIGLLVLSLIISIVTFVSARTNSLQGAVHLIVFLAYIVLIFDQDL